MSQLRGFRSFPASDLLATNQDYLLVLPSHFRNFFFAAGKYNGRTLGFPLLQIEAVVC